MNEEIVKATSEERSMMIQHYLNKYSKQKKEFCKLKAHEKDFICGYMEVLFDQNSRRVFNLYNEPEAHEYLFKKSY